MPNNASTGVLVQRNPVFVDRQCIPERIALVQVHLPVFPAGANLHTVSGMGDAPDDSGVPVFSIANSCHGVFRAGAGHLPECVRGDELH